MASPQSPHESKESIAPKDKSRRIFLGTLSGLAAVGLAVHVFGCLQEDPASPERPGNTPGDCTLGKVSADRTGIIASNHGHVATVTTAQQDAGLEITLNMQGTSPHNHALLLTAQDLADIKAGLRVEKTSGVGASHTHDVLFEAVTTSIRPC